MICIQECYNIDKNGVLIMKKVLKLICVLLIAVTFFGCSKKVDVSGKYYLLRIDAENDPVTEETMKELRDLGYEFSLTLNSDGTGEMFAMNEKMELTYDLEKGTAVIDGMEESFRYENGQILIEDSGGTLVFAKEQ